MKLNYIWVGLILLLTGCNTLDKFTIKTNAAWDAEKTKIEKTYKDKADATIAAIEAARTAKEAKENENGHKSAGLAYGIYMISENKPVEQRTRPDTLINLKSKELVTRLPDLTAQELLAVNAELKLELNEQATTLVALQKKYQVAEQEALASKQTVLDLAAKIEQGKKDLAKIDADKKEALLGLADQKSKADEAEKARLTAIADSQKAREDLLKMLIKIFIGIGVLAAIGAYAMRSVTLAGASAASFGLSVFIAFLEPWMVITAGCLIILAIVSGFGYKWYQSHKSSVNEKELSDRLVGSIQDFKTSIGAEKFKTDLAPHIAEWIKDTPQLESKINIKLKELNLV